jgi:hypothetical protein
MDANPGTATAEQVQKLKDTLDVLKTRRKQAQDYRSATAHAQKVFQLDSMIEILGPNGLRKSAMTARIGEFNTALAEACQTAMWTLCQVDDDLNPVTIHNGKSWPQGDDLPSSSETEQWTWDAACAIAVAKLTKSSLIVLDGADKIQATQRYKLWYVLAKSGICSMVSMTLAGKDSVRSLVKDFQKLGLRGWWLENGVAELIEEVGE